MSQQEVHIGKLKRIERKIGINHDGTVRIQSIEDWCEEYCKENNISHVKSFCDSWMDSLLFVFGEKFIIVNDEIYEVIEDKSFEECEILEANENEDGTIDFCLSFHNGGCGFIEALEEAIQNMKK